MPIKLEDDQHCFVCGTSNASGLKLNFKVDKENKTISTEFLPQKIHQGFKDIVHGGIIGLILDECMVNLAWSLGIHAVSAEYTVKLLSPAAIGEKLTFQARIVADRLKILIIEGECAKVGGKKIATSISKCIRIKAQDVQRNI